MATPVIRVATSRDLHKAPRDRKNEYIDIVMTQRKSREMKNCEGVLLRFDMKYTTRSKIVTWIKTRGTSTTVWAIA